MSPELKQELLLRRTDYVVYLLSLIVGEGEIPQLPAANRAGLAGVLNRALQAIAAADQAGTR